MNFDDPTALSPEDARTLDRAARRGTSPCGDGEIIWRCWGDAPRGLLLLHGGSGSWMHWVRNIPALQRHFTLLVPDLPGMGESAVPPEPWTPESLVALLEAGVARLWGDTPLAVAGFSFGGMLGAFHAAQYPARVQRLVLVDSGGTGMGSPPMSRMRGWRGVADERERRAIHAHNLGTWMLHDPARVDALATEVAFQAVEADRLRNREVSRTDAMLRVLTQVRCPVDGLWATEDVLFREVRPELVAALRRAGLRSLRWFEDAGHWLQYEQAAAFNAALVELLCDPGRPAPAAVPPKLPNA